MHSVGLKKSKEKPLNDISNKLEAKPVSLKSTRAGLKLMSGLQNKDSKNLKRTRELLIREELAGPLEAQLTDLSRTGVKAPLTGSRSSRLLDLGPEGLKEVHPSSPKSRKGQNQLNSEGRKDRASPGKSTATDNVSMQDISDDGKEEEFTVAPLEFSC